MSNSTSIEALYIVDDEYIVTAGEFEKKMTRIQEIWDDFIRISEEIVGTGGSITGSRANNYANFINIVKAKIGTNIAEVGAECERDMKMYISIIDEADSVLY